MNNNHLYYNGIHYGYPNCCIEWFVNNRDVLNGKHTQLTQQQEKVHNYSGFLPCPTCANKVNKKTLRTLISNRLCSIPFPGIDQKLPRIITKFHEKLFLAEEANYTEKIMEDDD